MKCKPYISILTRIPGLTPFWNSQTGFWASSEVATTSGLSYTYPEFNGLDLSNPEAVSTAIATYISRQYGIGQILSSRSAGPEVSLFAQPFATEGAPAPTVQDAPVGHGTTTDPEAPDVIYDWAARIHAKKFELGHGYAVLIFLGDVPDDPEHWRTSPSFVGAHVAFVNTQTDQCANCSDQTELVIEGFVHLNEVIAERSGLSSFEPGVVAPYLKENLHWRVQAVRSSFCLSLSFFNPSDMPCLYRFIRPIELRSR
jgi:tyrosinase